MKPFIPLEEGLEKYRQIRNVIKSGLQQHIWLVGIYREFIENYPDGIVLISFNTFLKFLLLLGILMKHLEGDKTERFCFHV